MKHHIVAIGISKHQNPFVNNLRYASKDAIEFFNLFEKNISNIGYKKLLTDSEATLAQIRTALGSELLKELEDGDVFFFFFSGHGTEAESRDGKSLIHYLIPFDATPDITNSCISISYIKDIFEKLHCKASFIFIDSCFSGSINSKCYPNPRKKAFKEVKTFTNTVLGKGNVIFTASKDNEEAIEDEENKNGIFSFFLLKELQKGRQVNNFPVTDIFTPVTEQVISRAKEKYGHTQTPTLKSYFEGVVYLPTFKQKIWRSPQILEVPRYPQLSTVVFFPPEIQLQDKKIGKLIKELSSLVISGNQISQSTIQEIIFEQFCARLLKNLEEEWEKIFLENGSNISEIPNSVAKLEVTSLQFILLGDIVAIFGNEKQMKIYAQYAAEILNLTKDRSGLAPLIAVPEIILAEIIYSIGVICLARNNLKQFGVFLKTNFAYDINRPPQPLILYNDIHYCDALGGDSAKVNDHIREVLESYPWLTELVPKLDGKIKDFQLQVNFLLVMLTNHYGDILWHDFGRFYRYRIMPLIQKIKYDDDFRKQVATLFSEEENNIRPLLMKYLRGIKQEGVRPYIWNSIKLQDLLTEEEIEEIKKQQQS